MDLLCCINMYANFKQLFNIQLLAWNWKIFTVFPIANVRYNYWEWKFSFFVIRQTVCVLARSKPILKSLMLRRLAIVTISYKVHLLYPWFHIYIAGFVFYSRTIHNKAFLQLTCSTLPHQHRLEWAWEKYQYLLFTIYQMMNLLL